MIIDVPPKLETTEQDFLAKFTAALVKKNDDTEKYYTDLANSLNSRPGYPDWNNIQAAKELIKRAVAIKTGGGQLTMAALKPSGGAPTTGSGAKPILTMEHFVTQQLQMKSGSSKYNPDTRKIEACYVYVFPEMVAQQKGMGPPLYVHLTIFLADEVMRQPAQQKWFPGLHITVEMQGGGGMGIAEKEYPRVWVMQNKKTGTEASNRLTPDAKNTIIRWAAEKRQLVGGLPR
jgi:hypothetical protein